MPPSGPSKLQLSGRRFFRLDGAITALFLITSVATRATEPRYPLGGIRDPLGIGAHSRSTPKSTTEAPTDAAQLRTLVQEGKYLYEIGKLTEAQAKLDAALALDPTNKAAQYYRKLIDASLDSNRGPTGWFYPTIPPQGVFEAKQPRSTVPAPAARLKTKHSAQLTFSKLDNIRIPKLEFISVPLADALRKLSEAATLHDPEKVGVPIVSAVTNDVTIRISPPLLRLRLTDCLEAITATADKPIRFAVTKYGVVEVRDSVSQPPALTTKTYSVDAIALLQGLEASGFPSIAPDFSISRATDPTMRRLSDPRTDVNFSTGRSVLASQNDRLRGFLELQGVSIEPPKSLFLNTQAGNLVVRATATDLSAIEPLLEKLQKAGSNGSKTFPATASLELVTRSYKLDPNAWTRGLSAFNPNFPDEVDSETRSKKIKEVIEAYFAKAGADLQPPKSIFYNERNQIILIRASRQDFEAIEPAILALNEVPPQVSVESKFVEISDADSKALGFDWFLKNTLPNQKNQLRAPSFVPVAGRVITNDIVAPISGILTDAQYRLVVRALEQRPTVKVLSTPKVTTLSGRQARVSTVDVRTVVTGLDATIGPDGAPTNSLKTDQIPFGPVLDVIPYVSADGFTIQLTLIATVTEFGGYEKADKTLLAAVSNAVPPPLPILRVRQATSTVNVYDGQTVVLGGMLTSPHDKGRKFRNDRTRKNLAVFVTVKLVDPSGNSVHPIGDLPKSIPQQP